MEQVLEKIIGVAPEELVNYFSSGETLKSEGSRVNCLSFEEGKEYSKNMSQFLDGEEMGLWVLNDSNDSNPYCYISKGPCAGAVIHYCHDPEPKIKFPTLDSFMLGLRSVVNNNQDVDDIEFKEDFRFDCEAEIGRLLQSDSDEYTNLICSYIDVASFLSKGLMEMLMKHEDFFLQESLASWVAKNPKPELLFVVEELENSSIEQVKREAKIARSKIARARFDGYKVVHWSRDHGLMGNRE